MFIFIHIFSTFFLILIIFHRFLISLLVISLRSFFFHPSISHSFSKNENFFFFSLFFLSFLNFLLHSFHFFLHSFHSFFSITLFSYFLIFLISLFLNFSNYFFLYSEILATILHILFHFHILIIILI